MLLPALFPHYGSFQFFTFLLFQSGESVSPFSPSSFLCVFPAFPRPFLYGSHLTRLIRIPAFSLPKSPCGERGEGRRERGKSYGLEASRPYRMLSQSHPSLHLPQQALFSLYIHGQRSKDSSCD